MGIILVSGQLYYIIPEGVRSRESWLRFQFRRFRFRVIKDFIFLACFGLTCTLAYQAVEEERFLEQYLLSIFVVLQVNFIFVSFRFVPHVKFLSLYFALFIFSLLSFCSLIVANRFASWGLASCCVVSCRDVQCRFESWRNRDELCRVVPCCFVSCFSCYDVTVELCRVV